MPRIAGIDIPQNKRIVIALTYIYGIGNSLARDIVKKASVDPDIRAKDLSDEQVLTIRNIMEKESYLVEGELRRTVYQNIKRYKDIKSYRGMRHIRNLPVRGQKTQKNARTKRGKRMAVGGTNPRAAAKT